MAGFTRKEDSELVVERKVQKAKRVLEFDRFEMLSVAAVKTRFTTLVKLRHPDAGVNPNMPARRHTLDDVRQAKDYLVKRLEETNGET